MSDALSELGLELEEIEWQDLSLCDQTMPTNYFYDDYESDVNVAKMVDEACLSCPVMAQCLLRGVENGEWGTWGGVYLVSGKPDKNRNSHKTPDIWNAIRERIGDNAVF